MWCRAPKNVEVKVEEENETKNKLRENGLQQRKVMMDLRRDQFLTDKVLVEKHNSPELDQFENQINEVFRQCIFDILEHKMLILFGEMKNIIKKCFIDSIGEIGGGGVRFRC